MNACMHGNEKEADEEVDESSHQLKSRRKQAIHANTWKRTRNE